MKRTLSLLAAAAVLASMLAVGQGADAQVQRGTNQMAPQPKTGPDDSIPTPTPQPTRPAGPSGMQAKPTQCLPGWSQVELKHDSFGKLSRMTCQSPIIECPDPAPGYTVGVDLAKQIANADDGRFRIQYRCTYYRTAG
jgi:hypothetical protein